ncbi:MAG: FHA domain-containing protein [bacterium]
MPENEPARLLPRGAEVGVAIELPEDGAFRVGREEPADLPLREAAVSREHAILEFDGRGWVITDLDSANGTFVDGRRVKRRRLKGGERIRFGPRIEYRFLGGEGPSALRSFFGSFFRVALVARDPTFQPRRLLISHAPRIVGRAPKSDLRLPFTEVSDVHARLEDRGGRPWVLDHKSRNGTFVNGERVKEHRLHVGDEVGFARTPFDVAITPAPSTRGLLAAATLCAVIAGTAFGVGWVGRRASPDTLWTRDMYEAQASVSLGDALEAADRRPPASEIAHAQFDIAIHALISADRLPPGQPSMEEIGAAFARYSKHLKGELAERDLGRVYASLLEEEKRREEKPPPPPPPVSGDVVEAELTHIVAEFGIDVAQAPIPPALLEEVRRFVKYWTNENRDYTVRAMQRSRPHLAMIRTELRRDHLPEVFCYLPFIESGYRTEVVSGAGAQGLWQFMPKTARNYGLRIEGSLDERNDPLLETRAACQYLDGLLATFGTDAFMCAVAAYNKGEYGMVTCLTQNVLKKKVSFLSKWKFWDLVESRDGCLKQETIEYVPKFLAAAIVMRRPEAFGLVSAEGALPGQPASSVPAPGAAMPATGSPVSAGAGT